jgi:hypothetical protein
MLSVDADAKPKDGRPVASAIKVPVPVFLINFLLFQFVFIQKRI